MTRSNNSVFIPSLVLAVTLSGCSGQPEPLAPVVAGPGPAANEPVVHYADEKQPLKYNENGVPEPPTMVAPMPAVPPGVVPPAPGVPTTGPSHDDRKPR